MPKQRALTELDHRVAKAVEWVFWMNMASLLRNSQRQNAILSASQITWVRVSYDDVGQLLNGLTRYLGTGNYLSESQVKYRLKKLGERKVIEPHGYHSYRPLSAKEFCEPMIKQLTHEDNERQRKADEAVQTMRNLIDQVLPGHTCDVVLDHPVRYQPVNEITVRMVGQVAQLKFLLNMAHSEIRRRDEQYEKGLEDSYERNGNG